VSQINYSIRLDEEMREEMRTVPDMPDKIRNFIRQEIERQNMCSDELPEEQFCRQILNDYGIVGAYCLRQRHLYYRSKRYYLQNIDAWFDDHEVDSAEARLQAKRIWNRWDEFGGNPDEVIEDILDIEGYTNKFYTRARNVAKNAVQKDSISAWPLYTLLQLYRHRQDRSSTSQSSESIKKSSITNTLKMHGFRESEIEDSIDLLIKAGGFQNFYNSNAYSYYYIKFSDYIIDAIAEGLEFHTKEIRNRIKNYCEEEVYLDQILDLTHGSGRNKYEKDLSDQKESDIERAVEDGTVVLSYTPGRSSTGRRSSLPAKTKAVLSPDVRQVVNDAVYQHKTA
jgi:hypothetical protein